MGSFFDVLEHLTDPVQLLRSALRWAKPGARVLVTVPALRAMHTVGNRPQRAQAAQVG